MKYTENYNLKKPEAEDFYNVEDFNDNADIIDQALKTHDDALATKETPEGAQAKANAALNSAKQYTDQEVGEIAQALATHKADGTQHAKTARFVIGTSTSGWTEKDCDYLCDGTNDQVEINNAINALPATGGEIVILDGTYNITARINVNKNNVSIRGNGNASVLKRMWNSSSAEGVITLNLVEGCRVENLQIDGNKTTYTASNNYGIRLVSSSNNTVTGNTCNNNNYGIRLSSSSNNTVTGNTCNNNNYGIPLASSSNNTVTGNTCNNNNNYGIYLSTSSNNTVTGNTCIRGIGTPEDYTADQYTILLFGTGNNYNLITSNNCMGKAPVVQGGTGNTVFNNKWDASDDIQNIINIIEASKKHSLIYLGESIDYGGVIFAIAVDDNYVYVGGWTTQKVYKLNKTNLSKVTESDNYGGVIFAIAVDDNYVYVGGMVTQKIYKLNKSNLSKVTESDSYGGDINAIAVDDDYVYIGGVTTNNVYKLNKTNLSKVIESASYGDIIFAIAVDNDYVYVGGVITQKVYKLNKTNLSKVAESASYGGDINAIAVDDNYVYVGGMVTQKIYKLLNLISMKN